MVSWGKLSVVACSKGAVVTSSLHFGHVSISKAYFRTQFSALYLIALITITCALYRLRCET